MLEKLKRKEKPILVELNDWLTMEVGRKSIHIVALCNHRTKNPPIKAVQMKIHKALRAPELPAYELWYEGSEVVKTEELLNFEGDREEPRMVMMTHRFHVYTFRKDEK